MPNPLPDFIPIIDLFAGPGGLGEGFSREIGGPGPNFDIRLSIEKDPMAHRTLRLRSFFRQFRDREVPDAYYDYLRDDRATFEDLEEECPAEAEAAKAEALCRTLGDEGCETEIHDLIGERTSDSRDWILIGGPPCQAYSSVGRARMLGLPKKRGESAAEYAGRLEERRREFEKDHRHFLYRQYLKIIADHWPSVFVMENVKGILSARIDGKRILPGILDDLRQPSSALGRHGGKHTYTLYSLVEEAPEDPLDLEPNSLLIEAERFGVPQTRHRVIILGVRDDLEGVTPGILRPHPGPSVRKTIGKLPPLAPSISAKHHSDLRRTEWLIRELEWLTEIDSIDDPGEVISEIHKYSTKLWKNRAGGKRYVKRKVTFPANFELANWFHDPRLGGICNHETRSHMPEDLRRYFFCACFARAKKRSPKLEEFPRSLLPTHSNINGATDADLKKFADRFRVHPAGEPSKTVMSHIASDGHYYIHYDPKQARSLTVREAARLQTFPDNYFFEGPRTQQYRQVGNAVPPYLAHQIAELVSDLLYRARHGAREVRQNNLLVS